MRFEEPMARHTSLQVGGSADAYVRPDDAAQLCQLLRWCQAHRVEWRVLGKGFNTLVLDGGLRGVTISLDSWRSIRFDDPLVIADAGVTHTSLSRFCAEHARSGMEFAVGIPGTVGGWLRMNAGTREREMGDVVEWIEVVGADEEFASRLPARSLRFTYRRLEFPENTVIVRAAFRTHAAPRAEIEATMERQLSMRKATQPVNARSFGSVFKNPPKDHAGRLIESVGLKGAREGDAEISELHANFIVNRGRARAADVMALIDRARREVHDASGILLETEVHIEGEAACG